MFIVSYYSNTEALMCLGTNTSRKVTNSIAKNNSGVMRCVKMLENVGNDIHNLKISHQWGTQIDKMIDLANSCSNDSAKAKILQKIARATKKMIKNDIELSIKDLHKPTKYYSVTDTKYKQIKEKIEKFTDAYYLLKAIQHNYISFSPSNM